MGSNFRILTVNAYFRNIYADAVFIEIVRVHILLNFFTAEFLFFAHLSLLEKISHFFSLIHLTKVCTTDYGHVVYISLI